MLMTHLLGIFAVWILWTLALVWLTAPQWAWYLIAIGLGLGFELLVEPSTWYLGVGIGGGAAFVMLLTDLMLVTTDSARVAVLRSRGR